MAGKDTRDEKQKANGRRQTLLVCAAAVVSVILVVVLQQAFNLDDTSALLVGTAVIVVAAFLITYLLILSNRHDIKQDRRRTCEPILKRFRKSGNASALMAEYNQWTHKPHHARLVYEFTKDTVEAFIDSGNYGYAKRQLKAMAKMPATDRTRAEYERYRASCMERMSKAEAEN